ncbi:MAG: glycoside hydrolase family 97 catalytic domain-containing protein [Pirellulales bacterium]
MNISVGGRRCRVMGLVVCLLVTGWGTTVVGEPTVVESPNGRNRLSLSVVDGRLVYEVHRDQQLLLGPSPLAPVMHPDHDLGRVDSEIVLETSTKIFTSVLPWGKSASLSEDCKSAIVGLLSGDTKWQVELRAYDSGVAFRYRILSDDSNVTLKLADEATEFQPTGQPKLLFNTLDSFTTSHESLYEHRQLSDLPSGKLLDCPLLITWPDGPAAAITEARVRDFAGMYLQRPGAESSALRTRLSPLPDQEGVSVTSRSPMGSPWRVILLADEAGKLLESNLLLALNPQPEGDFSWVVPGKTTFHWWAGEFEHDFETPAGSANFLRRHQLYIDFCARHGIAYHGLSGDGQAWYKQSPTSYGTPAPDANVLEPRPEIQLPAILDYARQRGVGIRLWVHWKPLSEQLDEAMSTYEKWGVRGLMIDFLDRDDQEMIRLSERMLSSAARHKIHVQFHGSSKFSGEQFTFPNLMNREGVLNLEYDKWSDLCTPDHNVNVAYTRALAGPVDYHHGGFRSATRESFRPRELRPYVMGTRCHNLALYVVYENPMPMVADTPDAYEGQPGFEFLRAVPTTWDQTKFVTGNPGDFIVVARRQGGVWYLGGMTDWTPREISVPLGFLDAGTWEAEIYADSADAVRDPNLLTVRRQTVTSETALKLLCAPGGGFTAILSPR